MDVVIVEDEPAIADTVVYALESEGLRCHWSSTGQDALAVISTAAPRLVLLDIGLPDMNGFDVFRAIRQRSPVPIIFLTSRNSEVDQVLGLELGADDYITKPFSPRVLSARVRNHLRRSAPEDVSCNTFSIDEAARRVSLNGVTMDLSRYEYRLLVLLVQHPSRIYSRDQLMDLVWESPEQSFDRTVDTHIKTLRKKIREIAPGLDALKTHRGMGYSYEPSAR